MTYDIPLYILNEITSGPWGPEHSRYIAQVREWYNAYAGGADFFPETVGDDEKFVPAERRSRKIKRLISTEAEFFVGKTPEIKVESETPEIAANMQAYLDKVLTDAMWAGKLLRGAKDAFIGGRVALKVSVTGGRISPLFIPADEFVFQTDPMDADVLTKIIIFQCTRYADEKSEQRWWRQKYYINDGKCYVTESVHDGYGVEFREYTRANQDTGLDRIPVTVIVNDGLSGDLYGESDVEAIEDEDSWYNRMRSQNTDSLRKGMDPLAYIIGANPKTFAGLDRRPGAVNDIQADPVLKGTLPVVGQLQNSFSYGSAYSEMLENTVSEMYGALGVPDITAARTSGLVTSGKGLKALYWPLVCRCESKWTAWKPALEWMARLIIDAAAVYPELKEVYGSFETADYTVYAENQYPLPEDEAEERTLDLQEVGRGRSVKSYLMKWGGSGTGMSAEDADAEIEQMAKEKRLLEDLVDNYEE